MKVLQAKKFNHSFHFFLQKNDFYAILTVFFKYYGY